MRPGPSSCCGRRIRWTRAGCAPRRRRPISNGTLVPVMIEPCKRPIMFELTHTADLSHWNGDRATRPGSPVAGVRRFVARGASAHCAARHLRSQPTHSRRHARPVGIAACIGSAGLLAVGIGHLDAARTRQHRNVGCTAQTAVTLAVLPFSEHVVRQGAGIFLRRPDRGDPEPAGAGSRI